MSAASLTTPITCRGIAGAITVWGALAFTACSDDEVSTQSAVTITPQPIDYGRVSVVQDRTIIVTLRSSGSGRYRTAAPLVGGNDAGLFSVGPVPEILTGTGLGPSQTATIAVTFRPCATAQQNPTEGNIANCPLGQRQATLTFVDNTPEGNSEVQLLGESALPPNLSVRCGVNGCGDFDNLSNCSQLFFGQVAVGTACELPVEVTNSFVDDTDPVADLRIEDLNVRMQELVNGEFREVLNRDQISVEFRTLDDQPLSPSSAAPLVVAIPPGATTQSYMFKAVFTPRQNASYIGAPRCRARIRGTGFASRTTIRSIRPAGSPPTAPERVPCFKSSGSASRSSSTAET
ncbi:MAG: hypothetical protein HC923_06590 [Myxococcales bacterium]|nr:hypothetical protein [Myxococcales bacterium]